jgi:hypothetical protein
VPLTSFEQKFPPQLVQVVSLSCENKPDYCVTLKPHPQKGSGHGFIGVSLFYSGGLSVDELKGNKRESPCYILLYLSQFEVNNVEM